MASRLTLRQRRMLARGISLRLARLWGNRNFTGIGNRATRTIGTGNAAHTYIAKTPGTAGNAITVAYVVAGLNTPLTVTVAGSAITVNVATNGAGAATSIAADVRRAVQGNAAANALVQIQRAPGSDGTGVVAAQAATALTGAV